MDASLKVILFAVLTNKDVNVNILSFAFNKLSVLVLV
jgi:hypothetical protein